MIDYSPKFSPVRRELFSNPKGCIVINVKFRVLGIYFGSYPDDENSVTREISVDVADNPTVYDVMKAVAIKAASGVIPGVRLFAFTPIFAAPGQEIDSITVEFTEPPRRDRPYAEGTYILEDSKSTNPNRVLQYYIVSPEGVQRNRNNRTAVFTSAPDATILNGDTIIWRQVSICVGPNGSFRAKSLAQRGLETMMRS
jgi:hypothetical protein